MCRHFGLLLEFSELSWRVTAKDVDPNRTTAIYLEEADVCRRVSPELNFLLLLDDRGGSRCVPEQISAQAFEALLAELQQARGASDPTVAATPDVYRPRRRRANCVGPTVHEGERVTGSSGDTRSDDHRVPRARRKHDEDRGRWTRCERTWRGRAESLGVGSRSAGSKAGWHHGEAADLARRSMGPTWAKRISLLTNRADAVVEEPP